MEHEAMSPELTKFHDILAPLWHAAKGPQRIKDTCAAIGDFRTAADAIAKATPPTPANADTWTTGTRALVASVVDLEATCKANDSTKFEAAFARVHESFHALMAMATPKREDKVLEQKPGAQKPAEPKAPAQPEHGDHKH